MCGVGDEDGTTEEEPVSEGVVVMLSETGGGACQSCAVGVSEPGVSQYSQFRSISS